MSTFQGEERPVGLRTKLIGGGAVLAVAIAAAVGVSAAAHAAQARTDAVHAMTVAAPAYQGAIELGGTLDALAAQSVQAKADYDAEQVRLAAEQAAAEAAAAAAAQAAAEAAAQQAAADAAANDSSSDDSSSDAPSAPTAPSGLPAGSPVPSPNGYYDTTLCASGSASTVNGVPTCD